MRAPEPRSGSAAGARPPPARFATRRRLIVTFAIVLATFAVSVGIPLAGIHRMERPLADMLEHEQSERVALHLRDAAALAYERAAAFVVGPGASREELEEARGTMRSHLGELEARVTEPQGKALVARVRAELGAFDVALDREVLPAAERADPAAPRLLERSHRRLLEANGHVHELLRFLHATNASYRQELSTIEARALQWTLGLAVLAPLLVVGAVVYLSRSVARPLAQVARHTARIAAGDLDTRLRIDSPDEFGALAAELDAMTVSLKEHQARLVESEKLAGVGRLAAGVAHELNNPLQVILGYCSLNRDLRDPRLARQLEAVEEEAVRCKEIVEGLLELSRRQVTPAPVDLRALCDDVAAALRVANHARPPRIAVEGAGTALGDQPKLRRVVMNLVKNAAEAAGPDGHVEVEIGRAGDLLEVAVRDSGPGVAPGARERLFEPFFTTKANGTGLGLAVSRAIAQAHGGDIAVWNVEPGAVFALRLPPAPAAAAGSTPAGAAAAPLEER
jgi:signal transduction histidine kinase